MALHEPDTDELVRQVAAGDESAMQQLLVRHRGRLKRMVAARMDPRLATRVDPSDVVQDAVLDASRRLADYLRDRPLPFYPWLRQIALERLVDLHRRHIQARRRSVTREQAWDFGLSDHSAGQLAGKIIASTTSPSGRVIREEQRERVRAGLARMAPRDREVLVMLYLEQLRIGEVAAVMGITEKAVTMRHLRAIERLRLLLHDDD
jgi:RNA polymerase sigma-70 factor (ECF subfamily)